MHKPMPPLNALRAFEAAARHLSLTKAAAELHVTAGALSHQIRGLEDLLGLKLFERHVRAISLTSAGRQLFPGLRTGFVHIRDAVAGLSEASDERVLVISTPPGLTAKWLAPRLYRFSAAHPEIDVRISSSLGTANFATDGVDAAVRNLPADAAADPDLLIDALIPINLIAVCSPKLAEVHGPFTSPARLKGVPLIHDESLAGYADMPAWADWFRATGISGIDVNRGLRFNSPDHALDATVEGAGVLLAHDVLAYDELRTGRLVAPFALTLSTRRGYHFVCPRRRRDHPKVQAFHAWIRQEVAALDCGKYINRPAADTPPR